MARNAIKKSKKSRNLLYALEKLKIFSFGNTLECHEMARMQKNHETSHLTNIKLKIENPPRADTPASWDKKKF